VLNLLLGDCLQTGSPYPIPERCLSVLSSWCIVAKRLDGSRCGVWTLYSSVIYWCIIIVIDRYRSVISPCVGHGPVLGAIRKIGLHSVVVHTSNVQASNLWDSSTIPAARVADVARLDLDAARGSTISCPTSCPLRLTVFLSFVLASSIRGSSSRPSWRLGSQMLPCWTWTSMLPLDARPLVHFDRLSSFQDEMSTVALAYTTHRSLVLFPRYSYMGSRLRVVIGSGGHSDLRPSPSSLPERL